VDGPAAGTRQNPPWRRLPIQTFQDDGAGYEAWLTEHPKGWVVNALRSPSPAYLKVHRAECATISRLRTGYSRWTTGAYIKLCAERREELDAWARRTLGADLQDGCHCVGRGSRARTATARPAPVRTPAAATSPAASQVVVDADGYRTIETAGLIPFEPKDATLLEARATIRSMLAGLNAQPGELLHGIVEGPAVAGTDLDNALLYNVGGNISGAVRYGVALERRTAAAGAGTRYRYRLATGADLPSMDGEPVVALDGVPLSRAPQGWLDIWAAVRTSDAVAVLATAPSGDLAVRLRVGAPRFAGGATAQFVKTMVDGVMTALHAHGDRTTAADAADRLAATIALPAEEIAALLVDHARAALGTCRRLVVLRLRGVQCQPEDDRISALRIEIDRSATSWTISGDVVSVSRG
jgi:hypothetical protein